MRKFGFFLIKIFKNIFSFNRWLERTPLLEIGTFNFWSEYQNAVNRLLETDKSHIRYSFGVVYGLGYYFIFNLLSYTFSVIMLFLMKTPKIKELRKSMVWEKPLSLFSIK